MQLITNKKVYDQVKYIAMVVLPALGALYFAFAEIWDLPSAEQVVGSIVALDAFLGVALHFSKDDVKYDGTMNVTESEDVITHQLELDGDPDALRTKDSVTFRVNRLPVKTKKRSRAKKTVAE